MLSYYFSIFFGRPLPSSFFTVVLAVCIDIYTVLLGRYYPPPPPCCHYLSTTLLTCYFYLIINRSAMPLFGKIHHVCCCCCCCILYCILLFYYYYYSFVCSSTMRVRPRSTECCSQTVHAPRYKSNYFEIAILLP